MTLTVGQRLHIARESKGLSLQDVAHQTRIPVPRLRDLEEDTYTTFGSLTYARTFLKDYSSLMGVDAHEILEEMHAPPLGGVNDYKYLVQNYGTWTRNRSSSRRLSSGNVMPKGRPLGLVVASIAVFLVGMGMLLGAAFVDHKPANALSSAQAPAAEETRAALPAPLPETQAAPFSSGAAVPAAAPAENMAPPAKKLKLAPGEIPKALPVDESPKSSKGNAQRS